MHVHFLGEADDGRSVSSQHAQALRASGYHTTFETGASDSPSAAGADILHVVVGAQTDHALLRRLIAARKSGQVVVAWWTPRAVQWALHHPPTRRFGQWLSRLDAVSLVDSPSLASSLDRLGIAARVMPVLNPRLSSTIEPSSLPSTFTVLSYLPTAQRTFHGGRIVDELIRELPDVRFLILGDSATDYSSTPNVESLGRVEDVSRAIRRATVIVQLRLDGEPSRLVYESLCHGRRVVSSAKVTGCHRAASTEECARILRKLRGSAEFNLEGREFVCREHDCAASIRAYHRLFEECTAPGRFSIAVAGAMQAAKLLARSPGILSRKPFPPLEPETLPPEAKAMRALIETSSRGVAARA